MTKGFFTIAQGQQYLRCAYALALSLKLTQSTHNKLSIGVVSSSRVPSKYKAVFDQVVNIPWKDHAKKSKWKVENEWKSIYMTPYDHTIKLDSDMLFFRDITSWWDILQSSEVVLTTNVLTYRNLQASNTVYRQTFIDNNLPNVYTALMYFQKTESTFELFKLVEEIFNNWERYYTVYLEAESRPTFVSTDVVFGLAAKILGIQGLNNNSHISIPTFVHMKTQLQGWDKEVVDENWLNFIPKYFTPECNCKIGNYTQTYPFHYQQKQFLTDDIIQFLEHKVGV